MYADGVDKGHAEPDADAYAVMILFPEKQGDDKMVSGSRMNEEL